MGNAVSRNAPCPCGSGKKFKQCCLGKTPLEAKKKLLLPVVLAGSGLLIAVYAGVAKGWVTGLVVAVGALMIAGVILLVQDPPSASGGGDPGSINFGA